VRTTVNVDDDVAAEVARLRREQGLGLSDALNLLARRGIAATPPRRAAFRQESMDLGARVDLADIGAVLELLDDPRP
jgi:hypothetical protein